MISEQSRIGSILIVALLIVAAGGAVFVIGGENDAPSLPEYGELTYTIRNNTQLYSLGSYGIEFRMDRGWYFPMIRWWSDDVINDYGDLPNGYGRAGGRYLDTVTIETPWGTKTADRYLNILYWDQTPGMSIRYLGVDSNLVYRTDLVMPDYHLEVKLTQVNFTSIWELDHGKTYKNDFYIMRDMASRPLQDDYMFIIVERLAGVLLEPPEGQDYLVSFNSTNTSLYCIDEDDISAMAQGHCFSYDEDRSLIGNGSLEYVIEEGLTIIFVGEHGDGTPYGVVSIAILEE